MGEPESAIAELAIPGEHESIGSIVGLEGPRCASSLVEELAATKAIELAVEAM